MVTKKGKNTKKETIKPKESKKEGEKLQKVPVVNEEPVLSETLDLEPEVSQKVEPNEEPEAEPEEFLALDVSEDQEKLIEDAALGKKSKRKRGNLPIEKVGEGLEKPNVIYLGRVPHGFYEDQMAAFFGQFGTVSRLRLSRSKKTGKSRHFAFIEFESPEVAAIVADCMHNYLLHGSILQCKLVANEQLHPLTWVGANKKFKKIPWQKIAREKHNQDLTKEQHEKRTKRLLRNDTKRRKKLADAGIEYDFDTFASLIPKASIHVRFDQEGTKAGEK